MKPQDKTFKVWFKGQTPRLVVARDDLDAAQKIASEAKLHLRDFQKAVEVSKLPRDVWGEAS